MSLGANIFHRFPDDVRDGAGTTVRYNNGVLQVDIDLRSVQAASGVADGTLILAFNPTTAQTTIVPIAALVSGAVASFVANLPTVQPTTPNTPWLDGGMFVVSGSTP